MSITGMADMITACRGLYTKVTRSNNSYVSLSVKMCVQRKRTSPVTSVVYHLPNFRKIRLESKWHTTFWAVRIFTYLLSRRESNKQKVWNEVENRERDWGETLKLRACEACELRARKTHTARFTDFFADFEKKNRLFCSLLFGSFHRKISGSNRTSEKVVLTFFRTTEYSKLKFVLLFLQSHL